MNNINNLSKQDLIRIIARMKRGIGYFSNVNTDYDEELCFLLNSYGDLAVEECDQIGYYLDGN